MKTNLIDWSVIKGFHFFQKRKRTILVQNKELLCWLSIERLFLVMIISQRSNQKEIQVTRGNCLQEGIKVDLLSEENTKQNEEIHDLSSSFQLNLPKTKRKITTLQSLLTFNKLLKLMNNNLSLTENKSEQYYLNSKKEEKQLFQNQN